MTSLDALEEVDSEFRLLLSRVLEPDAHGAPPSVNALKASLAKLEQLIQDLETPAESAEQLRADIERKRQLHAKYAGATEQWKQQLQSSIEQGERVLHTLDEN